MSTPYVLYDSNGDEFHLHQNYIRYGNRILDASFIATVTVKKHKLLFNNFKQNTSLPVLTVPFKKETDARQALNICVDSYRLSRSNGYYDTNDEADEVFLMDAFGGSLQVTPDFLKYRDRIISTSDVRTVHVKGRRVLLNHFKSNMNVPTMCVHFADKDSAARALNTIHSILWNVEEEDNVSKASGGEEEEEEEQGRVERALALLHKPADPAFLTFMFVGTSALLFLTFMRMLVHPDDSYEEL